MKNSELLTEDNFLTKLIKPTHKDRVDKAIKDSDKELSKKLKNASKLIANDMSSNGKDWIFYIQKPDGTYTKGLSQKEARKYYENKEEITPDIANAIVTMPSGIIVRAGLQLMTSAVEYEPGKTKVNPDYLVSWKKTAKSDKQDKTVKPSSVKITANVLTKIKKLATSAGLRIIDENKQVITPDKLTLKNINSYYIRVNRKSIPLTDWIKAVMSEKIITEALLLEDPRVVLSDEDRINPDQVNLRGILNKSIEADKEEKAKEAAAKREQELKEQNKDLVNTFESAYNSGKQPEEIIDEIFDKLVPAEGAAETVAGELIRAITRIMYRDYNDGDKFFMGYGLETCGSSASYLFDHGFAEEVQFIIDDALRFADNDDAYTDAINNLASKVLDKIHDELSLLWTINEEDSREYDYEYIEENQPRYEYDFEASEDVQRLVENNVIDAYDINNYVEEQIEYETVLKDAEVDIPWSRTSTTVSISNLTHDGYEYLHDMIQRHGDNFWNDLVSDHADELDDTELDDDFDGSY